MDMAAAVMRAKINSMFDAGLLDEYFMQLMMMRDVGQVAPGLVVEVIEGFLHEADKILTYIDGRLNQPVVDFDKVDDLVQQLKVCSSSVGAKKLSLSCLHFRRFNHTKTKEGYLMALAPVRNECSDVCNKFEIILQLEDMIVALGPKY